MKQAQREAKEDAERIVAKEERPETADRSYLSSDIGTDIDDDDVGVCPDNPEENADAMQVKAICVDEPGEASYLSGFIGIIRFKVQKVFANNEADLVKEAGKAGGIYGPHTSQSMGGTTGFSPKSTSRTFLSRQPTRSRCRSQI